MWNKVSIVVYCEGLKGWGDVADNYGIGEGGKVVTSTVFGLQYVEWAR